MLIYATSNRRHLIPEYFSENLETTHIGERGASRRVDRGEDLALRALRPVDHVLSVQPGRLPCRRRDSWLSAFGVAAPSPRGRPRPAIARRCSSRCSAARAAAASHGSSRRRYAGAAALRRSPRVSDGHRSGRRRGRRRAGRPRVARAAPSGQGRTPATGNSRAARWSPANRRDRRSRASLHEELGIARAPRRAVARPAVSAIRTRTSSSISSASSNGTASLSAMTAKPSRGRYAGSFRRRCRCCRRMRLSCVRCCCRRCTGSRMASDAWRGCISRAEPPLRYGAGMQDDPAAREGDWPARPRSACLRNARSWRLAPAARRRRCC